MRRPRRRTQSDPNQAAIVAALRKTGRTVEVISDVGGGVPDLLVGFHGRTYLLEVKAPGDDLSDDQVIWHAGWKGHADVVRTEQQAIDATP